MTLAIRISGLGKSYRVWNHSRDMLLEAFGGRKRHHDFRALQDITIDIPTGSVVGIMGRNGAGKSTLLRIVAGTLDASVGEVEVNGRVSAILELGTGFHFEYTGRENVFLGGMCLGFSRAEVAQRFDEIVGFAELEEFIDQPFRTYSSGMQARLTFAVATCVDPDVLIVDEALGVGDARFQLKSFDRIRSFKERGKSILLVSHSLSSVVSICDRAILLERGRVIADGDPNEVGNLYHEMLFGPPGASAAVTVQALAARANAPRPEGTSESVLNPSDMKVADAGEARVAHAEVNGIKGAEEPAGIAMQGLDSALVFAGALPTMENERRYGLRRIEIVSTRIVDADGRSVRSLRTLGDYRMICRIRSKDPMDDVCFDSCCGTSGVSNCSAGT